MILVRHFQHSILFLKVHVSLFTVTCFTRSMLRLKQTANIKHLFYNKKHFQFAMACNCDFFIRIISANSTLLLYLFKLVSFHYQELLLWACVWQQKVYFTRHHGYSKCGFKKSFRWYNLQKMIPRKSQIVFSKEKEKQTNKQTNKQTKNHNEILIFIRLCWLLLHFGFINVSQYGDFKKINNFKLLKIIFLSREKTIDKKQNK